MQRLKNVEDNSALATISIICWRSSVRWSLVARRRLQWRCVPYVSLLISADILAVCVDVDHVLPVSLSVAVRSYNRMTAYSTRRLSNRLPCLGHCSGRATQTPMPKFVSRHCRQFPGVGVGSHRCRRWTLFGASPTILPFTAWVLACYFACPPRCDVPKFPADWLGTTLQQCCSPCYMLNWKPNHWALIVFGVGLSNFRLAISNFGAYTVKVPESLNLIGLHLGKLEPSKKAFPDWIAGFRRMSQVQTNLYDETGDKALRRTPCTAKIV